MIDKSVLIELLLFGAVGVAGYYAYKELTGNSLLDAVNPLPLTESSGQTGNWITKTVADLRYGEVCHEGQLPKFDSSGAITGCTNVAVGPVNQARDWLGTSPGTCIPLAIAPFAWPLLLAGSKLC